MDDTMKENLGAYALELRKNIIRTIGSIGSGHIGGSMSIVEALVLLYYKWMDIDASNPQKEDRDKLVCSKGHAGPAVYSILAMKGYFDKKLLLTLNGNGTSLPSHCDMNKTPGIDFTAGSLGQGLSAAVGLALANKIDEVDKYVYAIIGDGESDEGQIWEAGMFAAHYKLSNLVAFTDYNKMQIDGYCDDVLSLGDVETKWKGFGWNTIVVDGHNFDELDAAIENAHNESERPTMVIMNTIKGKGFYLKEGTPACHSVAFTPEEAEEAIKKLEEGKN